MASHRYPIELLDALDDRTRRLDLPIGLTIAAALATLLELDDAQLAARVQKAADARPQRLRRR